MNQPTIPNAAVESVEPKLPMQQVESSIPDGVKPKTCRFLETTIPNAAVESVERKLPIQQVESSIPDGVKPKTCRFLDGHSALIGLDKDWLAQCQDNIISRNGGSDLVSQWGNSKGRHECALS